VPTHQRPAPAPHLAAAATDDAAGDSLVFDFGHYSRELIDRQFAPLATASPLVRTVRAQAARIITTGLGHDPIATDDRAYLVRLVQARTQLQQADAEARVNQVLAQATAAVGRARRGAVILAFMIGASLMLGAAVSWLAAAAGGQHRDAAVAHPFWGRWEVDRMFLIRER